MTSAIVAFYKDNDYIGNVYYNSDGYPAHLGEIIYEFLQKEATYNTIEELYGSYILDSETETKEIRNYISNIKSFDCNVIYSIKYDSKLKNVASISVEQLKELAFDGTVSEFAVFIEQEKEIMYG